MGIRSHGQWRLRVRFNNRTCALLGIPDLPYGAFEHIGNGKIKPQGGGGSWDPGEIASDTVSSATDIVSDAGQAVSDVVQGAGDVITDTLDKADNWTESVGDTLAKIDPGPAIGDLGESIDKNVIQPMSKDPVGSIATIAAIATQQYYLIPYIAAANTAIKGGRIEDIALSFGVAYAAAAIAPGVSQGISGATGSTVAAAVGTGATVGAGGGAAMAFLKGQDVGEAAMRGAIIGGVAGGVSAGYAAGKEFLLGSPPPPIAPLGTASEFGLNPNTVGTGEFGLKATMPTTTQAQLFGGETIPTPTYEFGIQAPASYASTPLYANYTNLPATELGILTPAKKFGLDPDKIGKGEFGLDPESTSKFGELTPSTAPLSEQYVLGSATNPLEDIAKKTATKYLTSNILQGIYGDSGEDGSLTYTLRRKGWSGTDSLDTGVADTSLNLAAVNPDKFELRKYANPEGATTLISFKDDKPQQPIPTGYEEVETIGAAKGGLIDSTKSETMVKYSKKPLVAQRKPELTKKKKTTRKGLAAKQS